MWLLLACSPRVDEAAALRWARRHEATLSQTETHLRNLLAKLPSVPGDAFVCGELTLPPGVAPDQQPALRESLCRQREALWLVDRREQEDALGALLLAGAIQSYGVVGAELVLAGPDGVEWSDQRGLQALTGEGAVPAAQGAPVPVQKAGTSTVGWGWVTAPVTTADPTVVLEHDLPTLEWRHTQPWHQATGTVRLLILAEGAPDGSLLRAPVLDPEPLPGGLE